MSGFVDPYPVGAMQQLKKLPVLIFLFSILLANPVAAGQTLYEDVGCLGKKFLSLHDAIALALRNSPQIRSAELQRVVDKFAVEVARNQFFPQYSFDTSATYSNGAKPFYTSNPKATLLTPYGTTVGVGLQDQVNEGRETAAVVEVIQPLLRGFGCEVTQAAYKNALDQELINRLSFKGTFITTLTGVIQSYYKLVQDYNNLAVDEVSLKDAIKLLQATEARIKAGKLAPTEIVQQQAQIATQQLSVTRDRNTICQDYRDLLVRLGLDPRSNLEIDRAIQTVQVQLPTATKAIEIALANNVDYQQSLLRLKQLQRAVLAAKNEQRWRLDLIGRAQQKLIRNKDFAPVNINQIDAIGNEAPGNNRAVILNLNIPIHDLNRKQLLIQANIALHQFEIALETQRQQLIASVLNNLQNLQTQCIQLKLSQDAVKFSQQSLEIARKKFEFGRATMFELTSLQRNLTLQQLSYINQQIAYLNGIADFDRLLGVSLNKWGIGLIC